METLIFLSGFLCPAWVMKTPYIFDSRLWKDYNTVYLKSKTPTSDQMVKDELLRLTKIVNSYSKPILVGHSLGGWWAANLAHEPNANIHKMVLWTPLGDATIYPMFFGSTANSEFMYKAPNSNLLSPDKTLVVYAKHDLIVPCWRHAWKTASKFRAASVQLNGGHIWQDDHKKGLAILKDWLKLE